MGISLFEKLCNKHPQSATVLKKQYRMNKDILELSNKIIYMYGVMSHGDPKVAQQKVVFPREVK
jgi:superfamily I DNA and/or RNA helicase